MSESDTAPRASALAMLDKMSVPELTALIQAAEAKRQDKLKTAKEELLAEFRAKAASLGLSTDNLFQTPPKDASTRKPRSDAGEKRPAKFRSPNGEEWSGRGRAPNWLTSLEKQGHQRQEFAVKGGGA